MLAGARTALLSAGARPFDFTRGVLHPGASLTRASIGTYRNSAGAITSAAIHEPRFNYVYNTTTGLFESGGLLVEPASTNLWLNSNDITQYTNVNATNSTANALIENADTNQFHYRQGTATLVSGTQYMLSGLVEERVGSAKRYLFVRVPHVATAIQSVIDAATGAMISIGTTDSFGTIRVSASQWMWFILFTSNATTGAASFRLCTQSSYSTTLGAYNGDGTSGLNVSHHQCAAGNNTLSSRIITTSADVTRSADVLALSGSALGLSDGSYTMRYTFDDNTTQDVATTIASGVWTVPTNLNRTTIKSMRRV